MADRDPDIEVMLDAVMANACFHASAQRMLRTMQDHIPDLSREEAIIGMMVGALGFIGQEEYDRFSPSLQAVAGEWNDFSFHAAASKPPYTLPPAFTRILKTMDLIALEDILAKPESVNADVAEMTALYWDIIAALHKSEKRAPYYGASECMSLDIVYDEIILQLQTRRDDLFARTRAQININGSNPKPPQP